MRRPSVVVTGASKGIGHALARDLVERGYQVFAGVLESRDAEAFRDCGPTLLPVCIDVTDADGIRTAAETVARHVGENGLDALINNAGIFVQGPLEYLQIREFQRQLDVNVVGNLRVTQAFLPLLRAARGRVINIGSVSGRCAAPWEGAYAASKFALEAMTDVLRVELRSARIRVTIIEPGGVATPMLIDSAARIDSTLPSEGHTSYGGAMVRLRQLSQRSLQSAGPPEAVVKVVWKALHSARPKPRYLVGSDARMIRMLEFLPVALRDSIYARVFGLS